MTALSIQEFPTRPDLISAAANYSRDVISAALADRGKSTLFASGGSTPGPAYEILSEAPLDWQQVTIGLTDERWVPADHDASNEALIRQTLLKNAARGATLLPMVTDAERSPFDEASKVDALYETAVRDCDLMILGMGPDAHTLSWFPDARGLKSALDPHNPAMVGAIEARHSDVTGENTLRMTLTLPAIQHAKNILLLITGEAKRNVLEHAGPDMPVQHMIKAAGDRLSIYWAP